MNRQLKALIVACGIALASVGVAYADDGDGGDSSISRWTGESYAYFHGGNKGASDEIHPTIKLERSAGKKRLLGDFYSSPAEVARGEDGESRSKSALATAPLGAWGIGHAFRDDTAA
jgi:hypothetical protein